MRQYLGFRDFLESDAFPKRPGGATGFDGAGPGTLDHSASINFELGATDRDQAQVGPYVGSGVRMGKTTLAGLPSFQVLAMTDTAVTLRVGDVGNKVLKNVKSGYAQDPNPGNAERVVTIPRWQYERMITRGLDQQGGGAPPPGVL